MTNLSQSSAVMSLNSLCLMEGKPPHGHPKACSIVNRFPQTQLDGKKGGRQSYLRHKASLKAPLCNTKLCNTKLCSVKGKAVNQLEEPDSPDNKTDLCKDEERDGNKQS